MLKTFKMAPCSLFQIDGLCAQDAAVDKKDESDGYAVHVRRLQAGGIMLTVLHHAAMPANDNA